MNICDDGHVQVVFEVHQCPVCEALENARKLKDEIGELKERITELEEAQE